MSKARILLITLLALSVLFTFVGCSDSDTKLEFETRTFSVDYKLKDPSVCDGVLHATGNICWPKAGPRNVRKQIEDWITGQLLTIQPAGYYSEEDGKYHESEDQEKEQKIDAPEGSDLEDFFKARITYILNKTNRENDGVNQVDINVDYVDEGEGVRLNFTCNEFHYNEYCVTRKATEYFDAELIESQKKAKGAEAGKKEAREEIDPKTKALLRLKYQPRLQEYSYSFDPAIVEQSAEMTNGDWESNGFGGGTTTWDKANTFLNKIAGAQFDGIDVSDVYGSNQSSEIYDSFFRNKTKTPQDNNRSVRLNIFRHPQTGMPMIAVNGQLINANRMNIYPHENGKTVEISFQCLAGHPILDLENADSGYPSSIPHGLFIYITESPFYWYPKQIKTIKDLEKVPGSAEIGIDEPKGYSSDELYWVEKKIEEYKDSEGHQWDYYQAIRKKEAIDPENNDYKKYFYVDVTIHNCNENPSVTLNFDNRDFALVCSRNRPKISEIDVAGIREVEKYGFGSYTHKVVANNQNIDPTDIGRSVAASNLGLYGKSEVAREKVEVGWDTYIDGEPYGRIFETFETSDGYEFNIFRKGHPYEIETIIIPDKNNYQDEIIITTRGRAGHLKRAK